MGVKRENVPIFKIECDVCGRTASVRKDSENIYNAAQAVRSIGWSFGKDKTIKCAQCRCIEGGDNYHLQFTFNTLGDYNHDKEVKQ
jgi:hypothetical protein